LQVLLTTEKDDAFAPVIVTLPDVVTGLVDLFVKVMELLRELPTVALKYSVELLACKSRLFRTARAALSIPAPQL
jgi:hypothetical protein